jgi:predicted DsbA family dithiol-disulfide isomerase
VDEPAGQAGDPSGATPRGLPPLIVEVWEDLVCPWCYLGRHHLAAALTAYEHPTEVVVRSRAFELAPDMPTGAGVSLTQWLRGLGLGGQRVREGLSDAEAAAAREGLTFDVEAAVAANTFDAHRLVELAWSAGGAPLQAAVVERLHSAHFSEGLALDDHDVLVRVSAEAGLEPGSLPAFLRGADKAEEVRAAEATAARLGITAVPCFVAHRALAVQGAQPGHVLADFLRRAHDATADQPPSTR